MRSTSLALALLLALAGTALAAPPPNKGHGQGHGNQGSQGSQGNSQGHSQPQSGALVITTQDRTTIQSYYGPQLRAGNCPPGLAKKNNGCLPPGQAKKWAVGQPLPAGIVTYPLPPDLLVRLNPPAGYTYARVGSDILMIAAGSGMVAAGISDLLR